LQNTYWPARLQVIQTRPTVLVDAAHNADGMRELARHLSEVFSWRRLIVVMGLLEDKALPPILRVWKKLRPHFVFTTPPTNRGRPASQLAQAAREFGLVAEAIASPAAAFSRAREMCRDDDLLCLTGSHYLIGALMTEKFLPPPYHTATQQGSAL
jgi:dihydrofolate synthase/folylpolyglutamate synthase